MVPTRQRQMWIFLEAWVQAVRVDTECYGWRRKPLRVILLHPHHHGVLPQVSLQGWTDKKVAKTHQVQQQQGGLGKYYKGFDHDPRRLLSSIWCKVCTLHHINYRNMFVSRSMFNKWRMSIITTTKQCWLWPHCQINRICHTGKEICHTVMAHTLGTHIPDFIAGNGAFWICLRVQIVTILVCLSVNWMG